MKEFVIKKTRNFVGKGENTDNKCFLIFPTMFFPSCHSQGYKNSGLCFN